METTAETEALTAPAPVLKTETAERTVFAILYAISFSHLLNDTIQALIPSLYPLFKSNLHLTFSQIGWITFAFQCTASLLQPLVGFYTDKRSMPFSLATGMGLTLIGLLCLSEAHSFPMIIISASLVGMGSAVFHPEASRVAHMAAGHNRGLAQSLFQVGGNAGSALGPALAAWIIMPHGQGYIAWFSFAACLGMTVLWRVGMWQAQHLNLIHRFAKKGARQSAQTFPAKTVTRALVVLVALTFSKYVYLVSMTSYYTFYLIDRFKLSVQSSQMYLFIFLAAVAAGTIIGGPVGDRIGRKRVIWGSILGVAPFSLLLPHVGLAATAVLSVFIGMILASAFSAIIVYAQELMPGKVGQVAGLFFGLAFGIAGIGAAVLGSLADKFGISAVYQACTWLPLIGLLTVFLPDIEPKRKTA